MTIEWLDIEPRSIEVTLDYKPTHQMTADTAIGVDDDGNLVLTDMLKVATGGKGAIMLTGLVPMSMSSPRDLDPGPINFNFTYG